MEMAGDLTLWLAAEWQEGRRFLGADGHGVRAAGGEAATLADIDGRGDFAADGGGGALALMHRVGLRVGGDEDAGVGVLRNEEHVG